MFLDLEKRPALIQMFKEANLNKARPTCTYSSAVLCCNNPRSTCPQTFITCHPQQAELKRKVLVSVEKSKSKEMHIKSGWYTESEMKDTLKMTRCSP